MIALRNNGETPRPAPPPLSTDYTVPRRSPRSYESYTVSRVFRCHVAVLILTVIVVAVGVGGLRTN